MAMVSETYKVIIPDGQMFRFVLNNYYDQPTASSITPQQAIHYRNYFNTLFRNECKWNRDNDAQLYNLLFGDARKQHCQLLRTNHDYNVFARTDLPEGYFNSLTTIKAYKPDGTEIGEVDFDTEFIGNTDFANTYDNDCIEIVDIDGDVGVYFSGSGQLANDIIGAESVSYFGNVPDTIMTGDTCQLSGGIDLGTVQNIAYNETYNAMVVTFATAYNASYENNDFVHFYERDEFNDVYITLNEDDMPTDQCFYLALTWNDKETLETAGTWESEYYRIETDLPNTLKISWYDVSKRLGLLEYGYVLQYRILNKMFIEAEMNTMSMGAGDSEIYTDEQGEGRLLDNIYERKFTLRFTKPMPRYVFETLKIAMRHEYFYINGKRYVPDAATFEVEPIEFNLMFTGQVELKEYNLTGVYDTAGYDFGATIPISERARLKIDSEHGLLIDSEHYLRI